MAKSADRLSQHIEDLMTETVRQNRIWHGAWKQEMGVPPPLADIPDYVPLSVAFPHVYEALMARQRLRETEAKV